MQFVDSQFALFKDGDVSSEESPESIVLNQRRQRIAVSSIHARNAFKVRVGFKSKKYRSFYQTNYKRPRIFNVWDPLFKSAMWVSYFGLNSFSALIITHYRPAMTFGNRLTYFR